MVLTGMTSPAASHEPKMLEAAAAVCLCERSTHAACNSRVPAVPARRSFRGRATEKERKWQHLQLP